MSVTPEFVGQVYKQTPEGDIWRANSLTPGDWSLEVQNAQLMWTPQSLKLLEIAALTFSGPFPGISAIEMDITSQIGGIEIVNSSTIQSISLPLITSIDPTSLNTGTLKIWNHSALTSINLALLSTCGWQLIITGNSSLTTLSLPSFTTCEGGVTLGGNTSLVSLSIPLWSPWNGSTNAFSGCALNEASVNGVLARAVANAGFVSGTIAIGQGTNAAPSGQGITDANTLTARGVTVTTN